MCRILILILFPVLVHGQAARDIVERKVQYATQQFASTDEKDVIVATPYVKNYAGIAGSPFWATTVWCSAEVMFKGKAYQLPELRYDCANDLMVLPRYTEQGVEYINLIPPFYPHIYINMKHVGNLRGKMASDIPSKREHFIFYAATREEKSEGVSTGYYHYLVEAAVPMLAKYTSVISNRTGQKTFEEEAKFFFMKDGKLVPIRRVASFSGAFPELKDKIDSFVEEHKINTIMSLDQVDIERLIQFTNILLTQ